MPSPYISGLPSVYGIVSFGENLVNRILNIPSTTFHSIAICVKDYYCSNSQQKYLAQRESDIRRKQGIRIITARDGWLNATIIIRAKSETSANNASKLIKENYYDFIDQLYSLRLCGGYIAFPEKKPTLTILTSAKEVKEYYSQIQGYFICDAISLCSRYRKNDEDALDTLLRLMQDSKVMNLGWLIPLAVGYIALSEPELKSNTRKSGIPHAYAEPVVGLGKLFSSRAIMAKDNCCEHIFWSYSDHREFIVEASSDTF